MVNRAVKIHEKRNPKVLDTNKMLEKSTFAIKPSDLVERAKEVVGRDIGREFPDDLAENFVMQFPVVGPLRKKGFQCFHFLRLSCNVTLI